MDVRLDALHAAWITHLKGLHRSPTTLAAYRSDYAVLKEFLGGDDPRTLTPAKAQEFVTWLSRRAKPRTRGDRGPGTGHSARGALRRISSAKSFCHWLTKRGDLKRNPFEDIDKPKHPMNLPRAVPAEWVEGLLRLPSATARDRAVLSLMRYAGLRIGEALALNVEDVGQDTLRVWGKGNKERVVPVDPRLVEPIEAWLHVRGRETGPLFTNPQGGRLGRKWVYLTIKRLAYAAGLPAFTPHQLRHTCSVQLLQDGLILPHLQEFLGHGNLATTSIYAKMTARDVTEACKTVWAKQTLSHALPE